MTAKPLVLVTGASGFLASHCVKQLLDGGYQVRGTVRSLSNELKVQPIKDLDKDGRLELVEADLATAAGWNEAVEGCKYVLHVASPVPPYGTADETTVTTAVDGTLHVLRAATASTTVDRVVYTSSSSAICDIRENKDGKVFTEADWADETAPNTDGYIRSKIIAERAAWKFIKENTGHKFDLVVINPNHIVGPLLHKTEFTSAHTIKATLESTSWLTLDMTMVMCDVRDTARAHLNAMTAPDAVNNRHFIAQMPCYNLKEMAKDLADEFNPQGYTIPTTPVPHWCVKMLGWLASWFVAGADNLANIGKELKFDTSRMKNVLGIDHVIDQKTSVIEMSYSMIEKGMVKKTPGFKPK